MASLRRRLHRFRGRGRSRPVGTGISAEPPVEASSNELDLDWLDVEAADLGQYPSLLADLVEKRRDGATVHGIYTEEECKRVLEVLPLDRWDDHFIGKIIGMSVGMIADEEPDRMRYLDHTERARALTIEGFGFDPHERLAERLEPAAAGRPLVPVTEDGREYNPGHLRYWETGRPGLKAHVGNEFRRALADSGMQHMLTTTEVLDHLSYFVVLQPPDRGGTFSVYDLLWDQDDASSDERVDLRDDSRFDTMPHLSLNPGPGDLIIFGGGWRWHRVEPLTGERARVTYGGFCSPSLDGSALHFWA